MKDPTQENNMLEPVLALMEHLHQKGVGLEDWLQDAHIADPLPAHLKNRQTLLDVLYFMDNLPGGFLVYTADEEERILYANKTLLHIFRCNTLAEFCAHTHNSFRGIVQPQDLPAVEESIRNQIANSEYDLDYVEYPILRRDGAERWVEEQGHLMHSQAIGDIFCVFFSDATEKHDRLLAEHDRMLNEEEQKLRELTEQYDQERALINREYLRQLEVIEALSINYESILYAELDLDQVRLYRMNARSQQLFGLPPTLRSYTWFINAYIDAWVHPDDRERLRSAASTASIKEQLTGNPTFYINYCATENDEKQYLQLRIVNVGQREHVSQIVLGFRRVDEEMRYELEQKQLIAEALDNANRAIAAKNTFLSNMSHDMRTPLNAVLGFLTLCKKNLDNPQALYGYLEAAEQAGCTLRDQIVRLLEMSWADSGEIPLHEAPCDLAAILRNVCNDLQAESRAKNIDMQTTIDGTQSTAVIADAEKLYQSAFHLIKNAITYTPAQGHVSVALTPAQQLNNGYGSYRLTVTDDGIGISEEFLPRIFEPFFREKNTTQSGVQGIGVGLSIVKNVVDLMDGNIAVTSEVGSGSTFTVDLRLPLQANPQPAVMAAEEEKDDLPPGLRLLLVEDNPINREIEVELLEEHGFIVDIAEDGSLAVEKLQAADQPYDLILMDIQMPVMNGWDAARAIRSLEDPAKAHIPIIALSANVFESDKRTSLSCGMEAHLPKPLDMSQLLESIRQVLRR